MAVLPKFYIETEHLGCLGDDRKGVRKKKMDEEGGKCHFCFFKSDEFVEKIHIKNWSIYSLFFLN